MKRFFISLSLLIAIFSSKSIAARADAGADGPLDSFEVVHGVVRISQTAPDHLVFSQDSDDAIINWNSSSMDPKWVFEFRTPNKASITLLRTTNPDMFLFAGSLKSPASVALICPNGVQISPLAQLDVSGIIFTTRSLTLS